MSQNHPKILIFCFALICIAAGALISLGTALLVGPVQASHLAGGSIAFGMAFNTIAQQWLKNKNILFIVVVSLLFIACSLLGWEITIFFYR